VAAVVPDAVVMSAQKFTGWVPLSDEVLPALLRWSSDRSAVLDAPCWGVRVRQENDAEGQGIGLVVESYVGTVRSQVLTASSGALTDLSWQRTPPTCTRAHAIYRAQGDVPSTQVTTSIDATLEAEYARVVEQVVDVQVDAETPTQAQIDTAAAQAAKLALLGGRPVSAVSFTLAETDSVRYGRTVLVGDFVTVDSPAGERTEVLSEVTLAHDRTSGFVVTSTVGDSFSPPRVFAQLLRRLFTLYRTRKA
jgi:ReqiPepy6 Gp37-like protein